MYFNSTISDSTKLLKPVLVFAFAIAAALTGLTQITQHRSHPIDVYVGFLIGAFIAAYLVSSETSASNQNLFLSDKVTKSKIHGILPSTPDRKQRFV